MIATTDGRLLEVAAEGEAGRLVPIQGAPALAAVMIRFCGAELSESTHRAYGLGRSIRLSSRLDALEVLNQ
jgi:hypothetical protein